MAVVLAAAFALVLIGVIHWAATVGSIHRLSPAKRAQVYSRCMDDLRASCTSEAATATAGALRDHCRQQAAFVELFPECDATCQSLANSVLPHAHR